MKAGSRSAAALLVACLGAQGFAQPVPAAPPFDVAYRAWEVVTGLARHHRQPALGGECARTFQAIAVPALRRQTPQEQGAAASACVRQARALCADAAPGRPAAVARGCEEFR